MIINAAELALGTQSLRVFVVMVQQRAVEISAIAIMCVNAGGKIKMYIPCEREINGMKVLINGQVYEMGRKAFRVVLDIAKGSIPFGIYAARKGDFCEMRKDTFSSREEMNKQIVEYQKQGFQVYFNGGPK